MFGCPSPAFDAGSDGQNRIWCHPPCPGHNVEAGKSARYPVVISPLATEEVVYVVVFHTPDQRDSIL